MDSFAISRLHFADKFKHMISERWCLCILVVGAKMCLSTWPRRTQETHSDSLSLGLVQVLISLGDANVIPSTPHMTTPIQQ